MDKSTNVVKPFLDKDVKFDRVEVARWWMTPQPPRREIFNAFIRGESIDEIKKKFKLKKTGLFNTISHPYFQERVEKYIRLVFFHFQVNSILALDEALNYCRQVGNGSIQDPNFSRKEALRHLGELIKLRESEPKIINPQQYNFIFTLLKEKSKSQTLQDLAKRFGFEGLERDEIDETNSKLDS